MQHHQVPTSVRLALVAGGITLLAGACAAATVPSADEPVATVAPADTPEATTPPTTTSPTTAPPTTAPVAVATSGDAAAETSPPDPDDPEQPVEPAAVPEAAEPAAPCGEYGPLPALPDSMPTHLFDTDGDGADDDEVTAYAAVDGWRVRVVQDGVTSEALVDDIAGWAHLDGPIATETGDRIVLVEPDSDTDRHFATDDQGCVQPFVTGVVIDDLVVVPLDPEPPVVIDDLVAPDEPLGCGGLAPIPDDAIIASEMWRDIDDDGFAEERIVAYFDGTWKLRGEIAEYGVSSELGIPGAGAHGVRVVGFADVDETYGGDEILAVVGGGASAVEVGVFSFLEGYCMFRYELEGGDDFGLLTGASVMWGEGITCADGLMVDWGYERQEDDTYTAWSIAYQPVSLGVFGQVPASDGFAEGLTVDEVGGDLFDCHGLGV